MRHDDMSAKQALKQAKEAQKYQNFYAFLGETRGQGNTKKTAAIGAALLLAAGAYYLYTHRHDSTTGDSLPGQNGPSVTLTPTASPSPITTQEPIHTEKPVETPTQDHTEPLLLTDPTTGRTEPYDPRLDRNGDKIQDAWIGTDGEPFALDKNFDGKLDYVRSSGGGSRSGGTTFTKAYLEGTGLEGLDDIYPGIYNVDMERFDDDLDGTFDRVVMTYRYSGGEDRWETGFSDDATGWASYVNFMLKGLHVGKDGKLYDKENNPVSFTSN